jgi:hypothetical protein
MKAHVQVFLAARRLAMTKPVFTAEELETTIREMFGTNRSTVSTHISSICVANVPKPNGGAVYNYLWRLDRGNLRLFDPRNDRPHATRWSAPDRPKDADMAAAQNEMVAVPVSARS